MKSFHRPARAWIIPPELFEQFDLAALDGALAPLDLRLAGEALTPFRGPLERTGVRRGRDISAWSPPLAWEAGG